MDKIFTGLDLPEEVKTALTERIEAEKKSWIEGAKNDPDFITNIRQEEAGKFFKSMEKAYKRVFPDLNLDEIEGDGLKRMEAIAKAGVKKFEQNKDATNQELQEKYLKLNEQYSHFKDEEVPRMLEEKEVEYHDQYISDGILKDSLEFETVCKAEVRPTLVEAYLMKNGLKKRWIKEAKDYEFVTTKDNLKPLSGDNKPLTKKDIIRMALDDADVLTKSNGTEQKRESGQTPQRSGKPERSSRIKELAATYPGAQT